MQTFRFFGKLISTITSFPWIWIFLWSFWPFLFFNFKVKMDLQTPKEMFHISQISPLEPGRPPHPPPNQMQWPWINQKKCRTTIIVSCFRAAEPVYWKTNMALTLTRISKNRYQLLLVDAVRMISTCDFRFQFNLHALLHLGNCSWTDKSRGWGLRGVWQVYF